MCRVCPLYYWPVPNSAKFRKNIEIPRQLANSVARLKSLCAVENCGPYQWHSSHQLFSKLSISLGRWNYFYRMAYSYVLMMTWSFVVHDKSGITGIILNINWQCTASSMLSTQCYTEIQKSLLTTPKKLTAQSTAYNSSKHYKKTKFKNQNSPQTTIAAKQAP